MNQNRNDEVNVMDILLYLASKWKWFLVSVIVFVGLAWLKYSSTPQVFFRSATVIIKDPSNKIASAGLDRYDNYINKVNVANEILQFRSRKLMREVVKRVNADVDYQVKEGLLMSELYTKSPVRVTFPELQDWEYVSLKVTPLSKFLVRVVERVDGEDAKELIVDFGDTVNVAGVRMFVTPTNYYGKDWFKLDEVAGGGSRSAWASVFGDRFYNQFAEDLVEQGFFEKEILKTDFLTEKNYIGSPLDIPDSALVFLSVSERLGESGDYIADMEIKRLAGYIEYGWIKDTPYFKKVMLDGTDLTGFVPKKNGYFGKFYNSGYKFEPVKLKANFFLALCIAYKAAADRGDKYSGEKKKFFNMLSYLSEKYYNVCILGKNDVGDEGCSVNPDTECKYPEFVIAFVMLYHATGNIKFLDSAKRIADNMIDEYFRFGLFNGYGKMQSPFFGTASAETGKNKNELGNIHIGGPNSVFYTALVYLTATVENKYEEIEPYYPFNAFYDADFLNERGGYEAVWDNYIWNMNNDEYEKVLRKGKEIYG